MWSVVARMFMTHTADMREINGILTCTWLGNGRW
jgi:hypothetical protein